MRVVMVVMLAGAAWGDTSAPEVALGMESCQPLFARLRARFPELELELTNGEVSLRQHGADRCLSGSEYTLSMRPAHGRDDRWTSIEQGDPGSVP